MAEHLVDVHVPFDPLRLALEPDPDRTIVAVSKHEAERMAANLRGRLRDPEPREVHGKQAIDPRTGRDVFLVASRWAIDT